MNYNERIRQIRIKNKLTAKEFSKIFGISESTVSLYESGKRKPGIELIIKISKYFDVSTDFILGVTDLPKSLSQEFELDYKKYLEYVIFELDNNNIIYFGKEEMNEHTRRILINSLLNIYDTLLLLCKSNY
ncbi:helix-turn-helix domain-containing protein [Sedimentibacter sp. MB31-C6]|uniref:helix-turn-helix domain-containing protein n=1 Tax=Sedimentibacter sp. MB31-C6 TaxID=3109366 RepID=UPI002DDCD9CC|nr:helix-turn-helix transcriptional regulator [Sedimentibacter sp. MB36-C1]WSI04729.1 helix-turn-helix transcriptional regulator [Sedimentibacter sp. MB36-C1]